MGKDEIQEIVNDLIVGEVVSIEGDRVNIRTDADPVGVFWCEVGLRKRTGKQWEVLIVEKKDVNVMRRLAK